MEGSSLLNQRGHITMPCVPKNALPSSPRSFAKYKSLGNYRRKLFSKPFTDQATLEDQKLNLLYDIANLKLDIRQYSNDYIGIKDEYDTNQLESTKNIAEEEGEQIGQIATEQLKYSKEIADLESEVEELSTQVTFFQSLFSQDSESKMNSDYSIQKEALDYIREQISIIDSEKELIASDIDSEEMHKKIEETMNIKELKSKYTQELKMLRKEEKQLKLDLKSLQNDDPEITAKEELTLLSDHLKSLKYKKARLQREKDDNQSKIELQNTLLQSVLQDHKKSRRAKTSKSVAHPCDDEDSQLFEMTHAETAAEGNDCEICGTHHNEKEEIV